VQEGGVIGQTPGMTVDELESEVRAILVRYEDVLEASEVNGMEVLRRPGAKSHEGFAGVRQKGGTVQVMVLPMHSHREVVEGISTELRERMAGPSMLVLREGDEGLLPALEELIERAFDAYVGQPPGTE
jgi:hypothetical protein